MQINFGGAGKERGSLWEVSHGVTSRNARGLMGYTRRTAVAGEIHTKDGYICCMRSIRDLS